MIDTFEWAVTYSDGTVIREYDRAEGRGFAEVDHAQVRQLTLSNESANHTVHMPETAMPVLFRRRRIELQLMSEQAQNRTAAHCIGWKRDEQAVYLFVFDDNSTLLTSDLQAV